jgi:4-amino-4-deoxy-L-arabinose transferase-like glycosyltransferase
MQSDLKTTTREDSAGVCFCTAHADYLSSRLETIVRRTLALALIALILGIAVLAAVPPVDRDALTHHLAVPKMYLRIGGIYEIPHVPFSYYPMNLDLLYMIPLYFGNDIIPKYIHFGFALLTAGLVISYLYRRFCSMASALLGGLLFLSLPVIVKLSITVYVDLGLIFFSTAALLQLLRWSEAGFRLRHLVLSGIFTGLCLGTKPNGMLSFFFLVATVPFLYRPATGTQLPRRPDEQRDHCSTGMALRSLGWSVAFATIALLVYSPWMIRNYIWTGNPVYPMAQTIFSSNGPANSGGKALDKSGPEGIEAEENHEKGRSGFGHFAGRKMIFGETLLEILAIPLRVFFQGQDDNPRLFDGRLNPYLLVFPLLAVLGLKGRRHASPVKLEIQLLGAFSLLYLLFAFFLVDMRIRYIAPIIPPLVILAVVGIHDLINFINSWLSFRTKWLSLSATGVALLGLFGLNVAYIVGQFDIVDPMSYLQGSLSRADYIQKYRPEYAALSFANRNLPENSKILALFNGNRIYYSERKIICDNESFRRAVNASMSSADLSQELKRSGISHVLVRIDLFSQWAESQFKAEKKSILQSFLNESMSRLYYGYGYALFALTAG